MLASAADEIVVAVSAEVEEAAGAAVVAEAAWVEAGFEDASEEVCGIRGHLCRIVKVGSLGGTYRRAAFLRR